MSSIPSVENQQHASAMTPLLDKDPNDEEESFPTQQLFKFAWQIAKGMVGIIPLDYITSIQLLTIHQRC